MSILSGFFKTKKYRKTDTGYQLQSEWTSASTVEMADGNTAETNLGDIKGITDSLTATNSNVALSAAGGNNLQTQIDDLNSNLFEKSRVAVVTGAMPSSDFPNVTWLNYPKGFTRDNCIIIGLIHLDASGEIYRNDTLHCRAELRANNITLYSDGDESVRYNHCKVVLYKYM